MVNKLKLKIGLIVVMLAFVSVAATAQSVPQLTLQSTDGRAVNLAALKSKAVVLSFGGTWVPLAPKELPALQKLADRFAPRGAQVFWVSINSDKPGGRTSATNDELNAFAQKNNVRLTVLRDPDQQAYKAFGLDALPTVVVISEGKIVMKRVGFSSDQADGYSEIVKVLDQLLK